MLTSVFLFLWPKHTFCHDSSVLWAPFPASLMSAISVLPPYFHGRCELPTSVWQQFEVSPQLPSLTVPEKTNPTERKRKKSLLMQMICGKRYKQSHSQLETSVPSFGSITFWPQVNRDSWWAIRFSSPRGQQSGRPTSSPSRQIKHSLPLIKKINKGIGHIRFTSIIAHVVLITVIKSYLPQISGRKCHDLQLKTHWKFYIF